MLMKFDLRTQIEAVRRQNIHLQNRGIRNVALQEAESTLVELERLRSMVFQSVEEPEAVGEDLANGMADLFGIPEETIAESVSTE